MFRIGICDDEAVICSELESIILKYSFAVSEEIETFIFHSGEELRRFLKDNVPFDMVFLDIELVAMNGVEVARFIREDLNNESVQIVFISAKDSYYLQLFDYRPMHFLRKPMMPDDVIKDVKKAMELSDRIGGAFLYKQGHTTCRVPVKDILYFESRGRQIRIATVDEDIYFYGRLGEICESVENHHFLLIHKSYLVNYMHVREFRQKELVMSNREILPISRQKSGEVMQQLLKYERESM